MSEEPWKGLHSLSPHAKTIYQISPSIHLDRSWEISYNQSVVGTGVFDFCEKKIALYTHFKMTQRLHTVK